MKNTAAFFDIDGTLYREGFIGDLFRMMVKCELIEYDRWYEEVRPEFINWDRRLGTYDTYLLKMAEMYTQAIKGRHISLIEHLVSRVINEKALRTYVYTRRRIHWHRRRGHILITISGSPHELVAKMAEFYNFSDFTGSVYMTDENDIYTGEITPMWNSSAKREAVLMFRDKYDLDLSASYSYGDTAGDLSMFELTGFPTLVNPTRELLGLIGEDRALKDKIRLIVERKDVTYDIKMKDLNILTESDILNEDN